MQLPLFLTLKHPFSTVTALNYSVRPFQTNCDSLIIIDLIYTKRVNYSFQSVWKDQLNSKSNHMCSEIGKQMSQDKKVFWSATHLRSMFFKHTNFFFYLSVYHVCPFFSLGWQSFLGLYITKIITHITNFKHLYSWKHSYILGLK